MDCVSFRRLLATEPAAITEAQRQHAEQCASCGAALAQAASFESTLRAALEVNLPPGLHTRIAAGPPSSAGRAAHRPAIAAAPTSPRTFMRRGRWVARAAASLAVLATVLLLTRGDPVAESAGLEGAVVQAIRDQFITLTATGEIGPAELGSTLHAVGLSLRSPLEDVRFAANCVIRGKRAVHWVLAGERAPITVFVIPRERISQRTPIDEGALQGFLTPLPGGGTLAVVGAPGEPLDLVGQRIAGAVSVPDRTSPLG